MNSESLIIVEHLSRFYGSRCAVEDLSLDVKRGEVLGLLGLNGAGKSTTMQILSGNLAPSAGKVIINGFDIVGQAKQAKACLGYLPDNPPVYEELTVDEMLRYSARLRGVAKSQLAAKLLEVKERCGLHEVGRRLVGKLSKGFRQRLGIAQALVHSPSVVIFDEPTVGLDPIQIQDIRRLIRDIGRSCSVILSTHILPEVQEVCDRVQIIDQGKTVFNDSAKILGVKELQHHMEVEFRHPPPLAELNALGGLCDVIYISETRVRLRVAEPEQGIDTLLEAAINNGWGLCELSKHRLSLEHVFTEIVTGGMEQEKVTLVVEEEV